MDSTNLEDILGGAPVQSFAPMAGGGDPFIAPITAPKPNYAPQFSILRYSVRGLLGYFAFFLAGAIISLSTPRTLILQYVPNSYTSGGSVSYTGAGVLGVSAVVISYVLSTLFNTLF